MTWRCGFIRTIRSLGAAALAVVALSNAQAQQQDNTNTVITNVPAGVIVDAQGVLRTHVASDPTGRLTLERLRAARAALEPKLLGASEIRYVSLNRLEKAIQQRLALGGALPEEMRYLAGLTRIEYVFFYPDSGDIVIAGPAEGWFADLAGRVVGMSTGRPVLELEDLLVALRAYPPGGQERPVIGCSIDPTPEGLAAMQRFLQSVGAQALPGQEGQIAEGLRTSMGLQKVSVNGVPATTHFAQVMVEADYRMKLIGIGLERPPVKLASYVERANPATVARNAMQRWYFMPDYECVRVTEDQLGMQLEGEGVKLVGENEVVGQDGSRGRAGGANPASQGFVHNFTKVYPQLARRSPVFAQLRNLIDMAIAAAFIQEQDYYGDAGWFAETLRDESQLAVETCTAPVEVETAVNAIWKKNTLMTPIGGGVSVRAHEALDYENRLEDEEGKVQAARQQVSLDGLADGQWWWD